MSLASVLVVDDSAAEVMLLTELLSDMHVESACDGLEALEKLKSGIGYDVILLDLYMPKLDGFGVLERVKSMQLDIPIIILTNADEIDFEVRGLDMGAVDYIRKPVNRKSLHKRIEIQLALRKSAQIIQKHNENLQHEVDERTWEALRASEITIHSLIQLLEVRNIETSNHAKRTSYMMEILCSALIKLHMKGYLLSEGEVRELVRTAPLHDIGKVGIPDSILLKPGRLTDEEFSIMKRHVAYGVQALQHQGTESTRVLGFITMAKSIVAYHHERFDGSGYPHGLSGTDIPLPGRLMAILDVYDALTSDRVYKKAISHEAALQIIKEEQGKHFDPVITDAFLSVEGEIQKVSRQWR
jgi:putative two-component system response regulator